MDNTKYIKDIRSYIDSIPYGRVHLDVERVSNKTVEVTSIGSETLRYVDNNECAKDILAFITTLIDDKHTGNVQFGLDMQEGQINLLTIKNTKRTKYQK